MAQNGIFSSPYTDLSTPGSIFGSGNSYAAPAAQPAVPFQWGQGGVRLTPEQLALRQRQASALQQSDYSPVQSIWQGLGRVADNALGAFEQKGLDKEALAQSTGRQASIAALLGPSTGDQTSAVAAAIASTDPVLQSVGKMAYERANPKPVNNDTVADYQFISQTLGPEAGKQYLQGKADPIVNIPQPGGGVYMGPRSGMTAASQGPASMKLPNGQTAYYVNGDWYDNPEGK